MWLLSLHLAFLLLPLHFVFLFPFFHLTDEQQPELNEKIMENLCDSANNGGEGTYDVLYLSTGYEPNGHDFGELNDSSVPFSFMIPSSDEDVDDVTPGKMLTEAHRGQVDYFVQEGVSVSQLSSCVRSDRSGQPDGERSGQPDERNSSKAQIGLYLKSRDKPLSRNISKKSVITNSKQLMQKKSAEFYEKNYGDRNANFRKFQSSTFDTLARRKLIQGQNTILELSGRLQELQNEVNCMNDSEDFQDAESIRSGNTHVTSRPVSFPPHPIPEGMLRHSSVTPSRREGPPSIWDAHGISGNVVCTSRCVIISTFIHKN